MLPLQLLAAQAQHYGQCHNSLATASARVRAHVSQSHLGVFLPNRIHEAAGARVQLYPSMLLPQRLMKLGIRARGLPPQPSSVRLRHTPSSRMLQNLRLLRSLRTRPLFRRILPSRPKSRRRRTASRLGPRCLRNHRRSSITVSHGQALGGRQSSRSQSSLRKGTRCSRPALRSFTGPREATVSPLHLNRSPSRRIRNPKQFSARGPRRHSLHCALLLKIQTPCGLGLETLRRLKPRFSTRSAITMPPTFKCPPQGHASEEAGARGSRVASPPPTTLKVPPRRRLRQMSIDVVVTRPKMEL